MAGPLAGCRVRLAWWGPPIKVVGVAGPTSKFVWWDPPIRVVCVAHVSKCHVSKIDSQAMGKAAEVAAKS
jgi:hypothetical protein